MEIFIFSTALFLLVLIAQTSWIIFRKSLNKLLTEIAELKFYNQNLSSEKNKLEESLSYLLEKFESEQITKFEYQKNNQLLSQQNEQMNVRIKEWELMREKTIEHAKAAIFEVGGKLSSKLLEDHKRETEEAQKKNQQKFIETTEILNKQFENIVNSVSNLGEQVRDSKQTVDIVRQALLSPSGAGNLAEITLENILKNSGLISGLDYIMQYSFKSVVDDESLRPDAIIFLPGDNLMIIDSKASKFFTEIAENQNDQLLKDKLSFSMRNHIKQLSSKNYQDKIKENIKDKQALNHVSMIMFLPSETALETLRLCDNEFMDKAWQNQIYPAGPIGLVNILSHAKFQIMHDNQVKNYNIIINEVSSLLGNLSVLYEHARKLGLALQSASVNFDKFAGTFNSRIVSKAKKLANLGIVSSNKKLIPNLIERYQVVNAEKIENDEQEVIENLVEV